MRSYDELSAAGSLIPGVGEAPLGSRYAPLKRKVDGEAARSLVFIQIFAGYIILRHFTRAHLFFYSAGQTRHRI